MRRSGVAGNARQERRRARAMALDPAAQIRLFEKLKLTHCARPDPRVGRFHALSDSTTRTFRTLDMLRQAAASRKAGSNDRFGCACPVSSLYFQEALGRRLNRPLGKIASERFDFAARFRRRSPDLILRSIA
jgi:hypothetical protein